MSGQQHSPPTRLLTRGSGAYSLAAQASTDPPSRRLLTRRPGAYRLLVCLNPPVLESPCDEPPPVSVNINNL
jgi:hypothetical protein